jgi:hypothetical protein
MPLSIRLDSTSRHTVNNLTQANCILQNPAAGLALLAMDETRRIAGQRGWWDPRRWLSWRTPDVALAQFPLSLTVTARRALEDSKLGPVFAELLQSGTLWTLTCSSHDAHMSLLSLGLYRCVNFR